MNQLLWDILTLAVYTSFPAAARILLQRGRTKGAQPGFTVFAGSLFFGVCAGMLCGLSDRMMPTKEAAAAIAGWVAQDISVYYATQAEYYRRNPRKLREVLLGFIARFFNNRKKK